MDFYREQAALLKLMAHPIRLQILNVLRRDDECVCHLTTVLHKPQAYVSQQLGVLRNAGLIEDHKAGTHVYYGLANGPAGHRIQAVLGPLAGSLDEELPPGHQKVADCCCPRCNP